jgi:hypothetical protein
VNLEADASRLECKPWGIVNKFRALIIRNKRNPTITSLDAVRGAGRRSKVADRRVIGRAMFTYQKPSIRALASMVGESVAFLDD